MQFIKKWAMRRYNLIELNAEEQELLRSYYSQLMHKLGEFGRRRIISRVLELHIPVTYSARFGISRTKHLKDHASD